MRGRNNYLGKDAPVPHMHRPNFCCDCGSKIVRLKWHAWTSRKFCAACAPRFRKERWLVPSLVIAAALGLGIAIGHATRPKAPSLIIQRQATLPNQQNNNGEVNQPSTVEEQIYTCGARTKKGTPCSRRVHGPVRCWQHKGMPPMLPQEKLLVKE
jgi:hypothetical protein